MTQLNYNSHNIEEYVWKKAFPILGQDPDLYRTDVYGNVIQRKKYGDRSHKNGWEIDHCLPKKYCLEHGISLDLANRYINLQPLQCKLNNLWGGNVVKIYSHQRIRKMFILKDDNHDFTREDYSMMALILKK